MRLLKRKGVDFVAETKKAPGKVGRFFREVRAELRKVSWPNRKELTNNTLVVIVTVFVMAGIVSLFDVSLTALFSLFLR
ncbi:MAG TPA: preprotein translocase subunit SecE [Firmicutes bacterium]|jgi:preprotein translocase subunit SecE|nr:preprotein translocase subunit SecE [Bacillota bacterium]HBE05031.1 preprotein translocase subunit SecE [Bacillota bacterium]HBG43763.1 preprotein translocase subunit SecE [Bacillota bacterium]HBL68305.1 preprotein translocase subunit SecE [Bacillota bacterium]HBR23764.1 preprotein translocase subunit SecE [Bacillota bacterium]